jgi:hypothetical protein
MYVIATVTLVIALVFLLILGFLRVARELLSRGISEIPSTAINQRTSHRER